MVDLRALEGLDVQAAVTLVINPEGLVLMVSRKDDPNDMGLLGGKYDPVRDKDIVDTAINEAWEEAKLKLSRGNLELLFVDMARTRACACFLAKAYDDSELMSAEEGIVVWGDFLRLLQGSFKEYNTRLLRRLLFTNYAGRALPWTPKKG